jgi:hypothetical protein
VNVEAAILSKRPNLLHFDFANHERREYASSRI